MACSRIVAPIHQRITPRGLGNVTGWPLREMAVDVSNYLVNVNDVVIGVIGFMLAQQHNNFFA